MVLGLLLGAIFATPVSHLMKRLTLPDGMSLQTHGTLGRFKITRLQYQGALADDGLQRLTAPLPLLALRSTVSAPHRAV